jgi:DNA polymerase III epsilon subunit-like protein
MSSALNCFNKVLDEADLIVGHNISFDKRVLMVESIRQNTRQRFTINGIKKPEYCTMKNTVELCRIPVTNLRAGNIYYKYPKLNELHVTLFGSQARGTHNALADILICLRCYAKVVDDYDYVEYEPTICHDLKNMYIEYCV